MGFWPKMLKIAQKCLKIAYFSPKIPQKGTFLEIFWPTFSRQKWAKSGPKVGQKWAKIFWAKSKVGQIQKCPKKCPNFLGIFLFVSQ